MAEWAMITTEQIDALEALLAKARRRPWSIVRPSGDRPTRIASEGDDMPVAIFSYEGSPSDRALIVAAVNALGPMCAEIRALRDERDALWARVATMEAVLRDIRNCAEHALPRSGGMGVGAAGAELPMPISSARRLMRWCDDALEAKGKVPT